MAQSRLWFSRFARHDHFAGVQELVTRSNFQRAARAIGSRIDSTTRRDRSSLQSTATERTHGAAGRSYLASQDAIGGDRLFRFENECDLSARVAERTNRGADYSGSYRATAKWSLSISVSSED